MFFVINMPTYKLEQFLVLFVKSLTSNEYTIKDWKKDSFAVAEEIVEQYSEFFMGSLDVDSLLLTFHLKRLLSFALTLFLKMLKG